MASVCASSFHSVCLSAKNVCILSDSFFLYSLLKTQHSKWDRDSPFGWFWDAPRTKNRIMWEKFPNRSLQIVIKKKILRNLFSRNNRNHQRWKCNSRREAKFCIWIFARTGWKSKIKTSYGKNMAFICNLCGKEGYHIDIRDHIETNHLEGVSLPCNLCGNVFSSRRQLRRHKCQISLYYFFVTATHFPVTSLVVHQKYYKLQLAYNIICVLIVIVHLRRTGRWGEVAFYWLAPPLLSRSVGIRRAFQLDNCGSMLTLVRIQWQLYANLWPVSKLSMTRNLLVVHPGRHWIIIGHS